MTLAAAQPFAVAHYPLDETSGTRVDAVGAMDLTDGNTVGSAAGMFSNAADFELSNSENLFSNAGSGIADGDVSFTARLWIKIETLNQNSILVVKGWSDSNPTIFSWCVRLTVFNDISFIVSDNSNTLSVSTGLDSVTTGVWYLVHAWHNATTDEIGISLNAGTPDTDSWTTGTKNNTPDFWVGARGNASFSGPEGFFDGLIDDLVILEGYVLDSTERTEDYNGGTGVAFDDWDAGGGATTRGTAFGNRGTAFNGGRTLQGNIR